MSVLYKNDNYAICETSDRADFNALLKAIVANWGKPAPYYFWNDKILEALVDFDARINEKTVYFATLTEEESESLSKHGYIPNYQECLPGFIMKDYPGKGLVTKTCVGEQLHRHPGECPTTIITSVYAREIVDAICYVLKLYLQNQGANKYMELFINDSIEPKRVRYEIQLPSYLYEWFKVKNIDLDSIEGRNKLDNYEKYTVKDSRYHFLTVEHPYPHNSNLKLAAGCLLHDIASWTNECLYILDDEGNLTVNLHPNPIQPLFEILATNKIIPCPRCQAPVYLKRETSTKYCSKSCIARYNDAAKKDFYAGMSEADLRKRYPYIHSETIAKWQK